MCTTVVVAAVVIYCSARCIPELGTYSTLDPSYSITICNGSSSPYTLKVMTWDGGILLCSPPSVDLLGLPQADLG